MLDLTQLRRDFTLEDVMAKLDSDPKLDHLYDRISSKLPLGISFGFHHISTPPSKCDPLFASPPGRKPERTYCESHFLTVSSVREDKTVLLFALEVLVFTTRRLTTIFVSKADSTGCLASLQIPPASGASIVRTVSSEFLSWLIENRQRPRVRLLLALFARAQAQYLFPASEDNKGKHLLDDRQLIRWWCKTLDPVVRQGSASTSTQAYLIVPGFDRGETKVFFPPSWRHDPPETSKWQFGHPLDVIAVDPNVPPRCLVPRFPDDPKSRYLDELDDELPQAATSQSTMSPSKRGNGMWKSVKTLDQFWEMMAFRQECSAGRMVGFVWATFTPPDFEVGRGVDNESITSAPSSPSRGSFVDVPSIDQVMSHDSERSQSQRKDKGSGRLEGPVIPRLPRIKKTMSNLSEVNLKSDSPYWTWPVDSRGQVVLETPDYTRIHDLLLRLDFSSDDAALQSTSKWLEEASTIVGESGAWGTSVVGKVGPTASFNGTVGGGTTSQPNDLSNGLVRKKRKATEPLAADAAVAPSAPSVNMLGSGLIRKKPKQ